MRVSAREAGREGGEVREGDGGGIEKEKEIE